MKEMPLFHQDKDMFTSEYILRQRKALSTVLHVDSRHLTQV